MGGIRDKKDKPVVNVARDAQYCATQAVADRHTDGQMDRWMDRHCATIRGISLRVASQ